MNRNEFFKKHRFFMSGFACHLEFESGIRLVYDDVEDELCLEMNITRFEFSNAELEKLEQFKKDLTKAYNIMRKFEKETKDESIDREYDCD